MNLVLATMVGPEHAGPRFGGWLVCGRPEAPVFWYAGMFIFSMLAIPAYTAYLRILLSRFVAKHPVITADSMRDLRYTIMPGGHAVALISFFFLLPIFSWAMLVISYGVYTSFVLWITAFMWIAVFGEYFRFDMAQTKTLSSLPCAGYEVYEFSRKLFRSGGMISRFPNFGGDSALIDPARMDSEYWRIFGRRFHKGIMLEWLSLFIYFAAILSGIAMVYDITHSSDNSSRKHYFRQDGTLRRETFSGISPEGESLYYQVNFMPDGRIGSRYGNNGIFICAVCEDGKYRIIEIIRNGRKCYSRKDGILLLHEDAEGNKVYQSPRLKSELPEMVEDPGGAAREFI